MNSFFFLIFFGRWASSWFGYIYIYEFCLISIERLYQFVLQLFGVQFSILHLLLNKHVQIFLNVFNKCCLFFRRWSFIHFCYVYIIYYYLPSVKKNTYELPHTLYRISYKLDTNIRNIDHFCLFFSFPFYYSIISLVFGGPVDRLYRSIWEQHIRFDYLDNVFTIYRLIKTNLYFLSLNEMIRHYSGRNWIL